MKINKLLAFLKLPYPITVLMMFISFIVGMMMGLPFLFFDYVIIGFFALFFYISGFNSLNGIVDINSDKISKPYRPLPLGEISIKEATFFAIFSYLTSLFLFYFFFDFKIFLFAVIMIFLSVIYSLPPKIKRVPVISDLFITVTYTFFPLYVGWSVFRNDYLTPLPEFLLIFLFVLASLISKNFEDVIADKKRNVLTLVLFLGVRKSVVLVSTIFVLFFAYVLYGISIGVFSSYYLILLLFLFPLAYVIWDFWLSLNIKNSFIFFARLTLLSALVQILIFFIYNMR